MIYGFGQRSTLYCEIWFSRKFLLVLLTPQYRNFATVRQCDLTLSDTAELDKYINALTAAHTAGDSDEIFLEEHLTYIASSVQRLIIPFEVGNSNKVQDVEKMMDRMYNLQMVALSADLLPACGANKPLLYEVNILGSIPFGWPLCRPMSPMTTVVKVYIWDWLSTNIPWRLFELSFPNVVSLSFPLVNPHMSTPYTAIKDIINKMGHLETITLNFPLAEGQIVLKNLMSQAIVQPYHLSDEEGTFTLENFRKWSLRQRSRGTDTMELGVDVRDGTVNCLGVNSDLTVLHFDWFTSRIDN